MLFLLKIAIPPVLVALVSLAARRWGPTVSGLLMGLPWMTGPVLFFLTIDKGETFGTGACTGIELGVVSIAAFMLVYAFASRVAGWFLCMVSAGLAFAGAAALLHGIDLSLWQAGALGAASLCALIVALPRPPSPVIDTALPWWDIPARMLSTLALVTVIMLSADALGPTLSGIVSTYPSILSVVGSFTHHQWGPAAVLRVLRGLAVSLLGFVVFFLIVGEVLPRLGLVPAYVLASLASVLISAGLLIFNRRQAS